MSIDFTKPVQTRDGRKVRILCTDRTGGMYPVVGLITSATTEATACWMLTGQHVVGEIGLPMDLVNVPPPKKKVMVEVRLFIEDDGTPTAEAIATGELDDDGDPCLWSDDSHVASNTIEMEYQP